MDEQRLLETARQVIEEAMVGCLATVDEHGRPHARYMGAVLADGDLRWMYSLSADQTDKVEHLRKNAAVCWVFATGNYERVVTAEGAAGIETTTDVPMDVWNRLVEFVKPYAVNVLTDPTHHQFDAVVTRVERVALLSPEMGLSTPQVVEVT